MCPLGYETTPLQCEQPVRCFTAGAVFHSEVHVPCRCQWRWRWCASGNDRDFPAQTFQQVALDAWLIVPGLCRLVVIEVVSLDSQVDTYQGLNVAVRLLQATNLERRRHGATLARGRAARATD
jgi:hypothetical protein